MKRVHTRLVQVSTPILLALCIVVLVLGGVAERFSPRYYWLWLLPLVPIYLVIMQELFRRRTH